MSSPVFDNTVILPTPSYSTPAILPHPSEIPSPDLFEDESPPCSAQRMDERIANAFGQEWTPPPPTPAKQYQPWWNTGHQNPIPSIGSELQSLANDARSTTRAEQDCATLLRNDRAQGQKFTNLKRKARVDLIKELVETYDARTLAELKDALSYDDRLNLYAEHGPSWKETAELTCEAYVERLRKEQETTSLHEYISRNNHSRTCQKPRSTEEGCRWLDRLLAVNNIDKTRFLTQISNIMNKREQRINALVIQGPTTTGNL
ncbi:unnamed protein product [Echinostoma caproni]|uniref:Transposase n=1 Tax=Echinostoma caproni TaxID=27848 RepID=A0A183A3G9_9TREM|nr:unnamed protein product [Echinostoma caproni]